MSDDTPEITTERRRAHWRANLIFVAVLLSIWFLVSFGCAILLRDWLDANFPKVGHAPFGFWMAQQGSIICFVLLLIAYAIGMNRIDAKYDVGTQS
ncbi:MAG: DUF4212 domain-containing protein [Verrucomicrobiota bacterium]